MNIKKSILNDILCYLFSFVLFLSSSAYSIEKLNASKEESQLMASLFPSGMNSIYPEAVIQGYTGDCEAISAIASLARLNSGKKLIRSYFSYVSKDLVKVTLPGALVPVLVSIPDVKNNTAYGYSPDSGLWVPTLERALAMYAVEFMTDCHAPDSYQMYSAGRSYSPCEIEDVLEGVSGMYVMSLLTNKYSYRLETGAIDKQLLHDKLLMYANQSQTITAGINSLTTSNNNQGSNDYTCELLLSGHEYSILHYDSFNQLVTLLNPYNENDLLDLKTGKPLDGIDDGMFMLSLDKFMDLFDTINLSDPFFE